MTYRGQLIDAGDANELRDQVESEYRVRMDAGARLRSQAHRVHRVRHGISEFDSVVPPSRAAQADETPSYARRHKREHRQRKHML